MVTLADDLTVDVDTVLPADVDRLRRLFDHDRLAEGRAAVQPLGVDVPCTHASRSSDDDPSSSGFARHQAVTACRGGCNEP